MAGRLDSRLVRRAELAQLGIESTTNVTTTPLSGGATYTGTAEQNEYPEVMVSCYSDVAGTLYFDFSIDGSTWRTFPSAGFYVAAGVHEIHTAVKGPRYFRARFVNGSSAQTTFQLYTYYGTFRQLSAPLNQATSLDADAIIVRNSIAEDEIVRGLRTNVINFNKFSYKDNTTAAGGDEIVWPSSTGTFSVMTSAQTLTITYNNATDGLGTTGATSLLISYIDENFELQTATHVLGNTGSDTSAFTCLGVNRVVVLASGTANVNTNAISLSASAGGFGLQAYLAAGVSVTQQAILHIPINYTGVLKRISLEATKISGGASPRATFKGFVYNRLVDTQYMLFRNVIDTSVENHFEVVYPTGFALGGRDVFFWTVDSDTNNCVVEVGFDITLYGPY